MADQAPAEKMLRLGRRAHRKIATLASRRLFGAAPALNAWGIPKVTNGRLIRFGPSAMLDPDVELGVADGAQLTFGDNVLIGHHCIFSAHTSITIGSDVLFGPYCYVVDANHGTEPGPLIRLQPMHSAPIVIGDNVWIAARAMITAGITIGEGAVVGAGSVVTRDVPPFTIVGGVPARIIRERKAGHHEA